MLCDYGCGKESKFTFKNGKQCCSSGVGGCDAHKKKTSAGIQKSHDSGTRTYTYNPKSNWAKGKKFVSDDRVFAKNSLYSNEMVKGRIVNENKLEYKCSKCSIDSWLGETIVLDLDHINGDNTDNRLTNLRFLCPNCHSQTDTYKGRNKNSGKLKVTDDQLINAYKQSKSIREALLSVGLAAKGGNYERIKKLIAGMAELADAPVLSTDA